MAATVVLGVTLEELARNLCEEANGPAPGYGSFGKTDPRRGWSRAVSGAPLQRHPALSAVRGK